MASARAMIDLLTLKRATCCGVATSLMLLVVGCSAQPPVQQIPAAAVITPPVDAPVVPSPAPVAAPMAETVLPATSTPAFRAWVEALRAEMIAKGISASTFDAAMTGVELNPRVIELDRDQLQSTTTYASYVGKRLTASLIARGRAAYAANATPIEAAAQTYGVPGAVMVGIWGNESSYGGDMGRSDVIRSLVTLAYDGRRADLFRRELFAALMLMEQKKVTREQLVGSWAGAMGNTQFMPSSIMDYGVDADGDGQVNLRASLADVFGSVGNYLKLKGWQPNLAWGFRAIVPAGFDSVAIAETLPATGCKRAFIKHSKLRPASVWRAEGFAPASAASAWPADDVPMALVLPDGPGGIGFLTTVNYRVILDYNCSNYYALTVLGLADAVR
jgi:membrane-bound lytic murein transglycosylase B